MNQYFALSTIIERAKGDGDFARAIRAARDTYPLMPAVVRQIKKDYGRFDLAASHAVHGAGILMAVMGVRAAEQTAEDVRQQTQEEKEPAAKQAELPAPEQQPRTEEKKLLPPDEVEARHKDFIERRSYDAAAGPESQPGELERLRETRDKRIRVQPKDRIAALKQLSANAEAFRAALASEGYILARGNRGDLMVVDSTGAVYGLARQIPGMTAIEFQEFMKGIDRGRLPTVPQAGLLHRQEWNDKRQQERAEAATLEQRAQQPPQPQKEG